MGTKLNSSVSSSSSSSSSSGGGDDDDLVTRYSRIIAKGLAFVVVIVGVAFQTKVSKNHARLLESSRNILQFLCSFAYLTFMKLLMFVSSNDSVEV